MENTDTISKLFVLSAQVIMFTDVMAKWEHTQGKRWDLTLNPAGRRKLCLVRRMINCLQWQKRFCGKCSSWASTLLYLWYPPRAWGSQLKLHDLQSKALLRSKRIKIEHSPALTVKRRSFVTLRSSVSVHCQTLKSYWSFRKMLIFSPQKE